MVAALVAQVQGTMWPTLSQNKPLPYQHTAMSKNMHASFQKIYAATAITKPGESPEPESTALTEIKGIGGNTQLILPSDAESYALLSPQGSGTVNGIVGVPKLAFKPPVPKPSLYSQGIMGKPTTPPYLEGFRRHSDGIVNFFGGPYKSPEAKPSLYSQGITGKKAYKPPQPAYGSPSGWGKYAMAAKAAPAAPAAEPEPAAPAEEAASEGKGVEALAAQTPASTLVVPMALFAATALIFTMLRFRRNASAKGKEMLLPLNA